MLRELYHGLFPGKVHFLFIIIINYIILISKTAGSKLPENQRSLGCINISTGPIGENDKVYSAMKLVIGMVFGSFAARLGTVIATKIEKV